MIRKFTYNVTSAKKEFVKSKQIFRSEIPADVNIEKLVIRQFKKNLK